MRPQYPGGMVSACQFVFGLEISISIQQSKSSLQFTLYQDDRAMRMDCVQLSHGLGAVAVAAQIGNAVLEDIRFARPSTSADTTTDTVITFGTEAFHLLPAANLRSWLVAYGAGTRATFFLILTLVGVTFLAACAMKTDDWQKHKLK